jgi:anti-anti-sigma factor
MKITTARVDGTAIVSIAGELRIATVADAKPGLVAALATCDEIQVDLSGIAQCDTAGIQLLLMACASARAKGKRFATMNHPAWFGAALERVGIPLDCFESLAADLDDRGR